jgi:hypothetical protein
VSSTKDYLFQVQADRADKWIRKKLTDKDADEESEEYQELERDYWGLQEYLANQAEFEAELAWLKKTGSSVHHKSFVDQLSVLKNVVKNPGYDEKYIIYKMAYAYAVTLLESYLGDTAKSLISESNQHFKNGISNVDELKKAKYSLEFLAGSNIDATGLAIKELSQILYHNIPKVKCVFEGILATHLDLEIERLNQIISIRHDIAHRNGRTKGGVPIPITSEVVLDMIRELETFANMLQRQINDAS